MTTPWLDCLYITSLAPYHPSIAETVETVAPTASAGGLYPVAEFNSVKALS